MDGDTANKSHAANQRPELKYDMTGLPLFNCSDVKPPTIGTELTT